MSAQDCLRDLIIPAMEVVHDKVNFTLSYIGTPTDNDGVACKHGPEECESTSTTPRLSKCRQKGLDLC